MIEYIYISKQGSRVCKNDNRIEVIYEGETIKSFPGLGVKVIEIFGNIELSMPMISFCLKNGIEVILHSHSGKYHGRLVGDFGIWDRTVLEAQLSKSSDSVYRLQMSKKILLAKVHNQLTVLRRYSDNTQTVQSDRINKLKVISGKMETCESIEQLMGLEGNAARFYFLCLGNILDVPFSFERRSRRPAKDPFNALINLGYSLLYQEILGKIIGCRIDPAIGFMHSDNERRYSLVCDLIEEWRPVIVDSLAMSLLKGKELSESDFEYDEVVKGVKISPRAIKLFINKLERKMEEPQSYLEYSDRPMTYRSAIYMQIRKYSAVITSSDPGLYNPIKIR